jgi:hypothetical protein
VPHSLVTLIPTAVPVPIPVPVTQRPHAALLSGVLSLSGRGMIATTVSLPLSPVTSAASGQRCAQQEAQAQVVRSSGGGVIRTGLYGSHLISRTIIDLVSSSDDENPVLSSPKKVPAKKLGEEEPPKKKARLKTTSGVRIKTEFPPKAFGEANCDEVTEGK